MKKLILTAIFTIILSLSAFSVTEEGNIDKEDEALKSDLYLSDTDFMLKYVKGLKGAETSYLYKIYTNTNVPEVKIAILQAAQEKGWEDKGVIRLFRQGLRESFYNYSHLKQPLEASKNWKVRAVAAYLLHQKPTISDPVSKRKLVNALIFNIRNDPEARVQGISALALAKLFEADTDDPKKNVERSDTLSKGAIIEILNEQLSKVTINQQFYCWSLVKSLGILKSNKSFFVLLSTRKRGFNQKVKLEISRSLTAITGGSVGGGATK